jgi:dTDP-4-dehydrorhamnose reductase
MRILIYGVTGMLGHKLYQAFQGEHEVFGTIRGRRESLSRYDVLFDLSKIIDGVDVANADSLKAAIAASRPDVVINAIGLVKQLIGPDDVIEALAINAIFPQRLARLRDEHGFRLISISTDCVFDGRKGNYSETDTADADDLHGRSKFLGEVTRDGCLTIRTSIIGRELAGSHSLLEWFLSNRGGKIDGFRRAIFSGFPTTVIADIIKRLVNEHPDVTGLYHIASTPISKFELLSKINDRFGTDIEIEPVEEFIADRSLDATKFIDRTGIVAPTWDEMIDTMASDPTPYDRYRK